MKVNYVREHMRFIEYAADEGVSANERLLWYALMHIFNQRAEGSEWPDGFIRITNDRLFTYLPIRWDALARARNSLKQRGLIDFRNGSRNKAAPEYRMIWFYPQGYPAKTDKLGGCAGDCGGDKAGDCVDGSMGDIIYKHKDQSERKTCGIQTEKRIEEDVVEVVDPRAREEEETDPEERNRIRTIRDGFLTAFGRKPYPPEVKRLDVVGRIWDFSAVMIVEAMVKAAQNGAKNPVQLTLAILDEWRQHEVRKPHQVGGYSFEYGLRTGTIIGTGDLEENRKLAAELYQERKEENQC